MVYALQPTTGGPIKIGHSVDVPARVRQLEAHYGQPLAVLATWPGGPSEERVIHAQFAHLRIGRTEQFQPAADLMSFLGRPLLVGANPAAVAAIPGRCQVAVAQVRGSLAYREWLNSMSKDSLIPVASIVRDALAKWATQRGYGEPPEL